MAAGRQHGEPHDCPTRSGAPDAVAQPEMQCVAIGRHTESGELGQSVAVIEATLLERRKLP